MKVGYLKILEIADSVRPSPSERFSKVIYQLLLSFEWEFGDLLKHSLRRSELLDLERADISEDCITVHGSRVPNSKNRLVHKETNKTSASTRTVPIVIPRLKEILPKDDGYLIRCYCNTPTIQINRLCRANNLPEVGLHGLRRSFASLAHHLGWDIRTTMRYGGWSDYKTMNDFYIKLDEFDLLRDATKMVEFYSAAVS